MNELIDRIQARRGVDRATARQALGLIVGFVRREAPPADIARLLADLPGAADLADETPEAGGLLGGGLFGTFAALTGLGLNLDQIKGIGDEFLAYARENSDPVAVDRVIAGIPGLGQLV